MSTTHSAGLEGVIAGATRLSRVDGERGELVIGGYAAEELAPQATFEEVLFLLWNDLLPTAREADELHRELAALRTLPAATSQLLVALAAQRVAPMEALRIASATLVIDAAEASERRQALTMVARMPVVVAAYARLLSGLTPIEPDASLAHAANFLFMLEGSVPTAARARALDTYLNTISDHGMNASTFTARVIVSTEASLVSGITGAIGALSGPLHGGAPGPVLDMLDEIEREGDAERWLRRAIESNTRLMGFGHRIYKVRDPRADILAAAAERLYAGDADAAFYTFARRVETLAIQLLEEYKPGRRLQTNVEFYTALLLRGVGIDRSLFSPLFALGRVAGWTAHIFEQRSGNRLVRPQSEYVGAAGRRFAPVSER